MTNDGLSLDYISPVFVRGLVIGLHPSASRFLDLIGGYFLVKVAEGVLVPWPEVGLSAEFRTDFSINRPKEVLDFVSCCVWKTYLESRTCAHQWVHVMVSS